MQEYQYRVRLTSTAADVVRQLLQAAIDPNFTTTLDETELVAAVALYNKLRRLTEREG